MSIRNKFAFVCIAVPALAELGFGVAYFAASEVMSYHNQALGVEWSQLEPGVRTMLLILVNGYGSAHLAVGVVLTALLLFPLRQGQVWARWTILAIGLPVLGATAYLSARLAVTTGANVPWQGTAIFLVFFIIGVVLADPKTVIHRVDTPGRQQPVFPPVAGG